MKRGVLIAFLLLPAAALAEEDAPPDPGAESYAAYCATCHGALGMGAGPTAALMTIPVPDLTLLAARNGGTFPLARVLAQIEGRDPLLAHGAPMPFYGGAFNRGGRLTVDTPDGPVEAPRAAVEIARWLEARQRPAPSEQ
jgi:mono/diheme cytochrome c family protein